jgi:AraC-like DNA-binding protein
MSDQTLHHTFPAAYALQLVELCKRWNVVPEQLLSESGRSEQDLEVPKARVPAHTMAALTERARTLTGEQGLGFYLGLQKRMSAYGIVGITAMHASTLREAIELAVRYSPTLTSAVSLRLRASGSVAALVVEEHVDLGSARDIALFSCLVGLRQFGGALTGRTPKNGAVDLAIPRPAYFTRFSHLLPEVRFDQPCSQLLFPARALDLPLVTPDRAALRMLQEECERSLLELGFDRSLSERVRRLAQVSDGFRSIEQVADVLHVSSRTLKRRLAEHGVTYSALVDEERRQQALMLLRSSTLSLEEISLRLGYSTVPNFSRAFRRWTGGTPGSYRRNRVQSMVGLSASVGVGSGATDTVAPQQGFEIAS